MNIKNILLFIGGLIIGGTAGVFGTKKYFKDKYEKLYEEDHELLEEYYQRINGKYAEKDQKDTCAYCDYFDTEKSICNRSGNKIEKPHATDCIHWRSIDIGVDSPNETDSVPGGRMSHEERKVIKKSLKNTAKPNTNYAAMYRGNRSKTDPVNDTAESEHPLDQGEVGEEAPICESCKYFDYDKNYCNFSKEPMERDESCSEFVSSLSKDSDYKADEEAFDEHQKNKDKPPKIISAEAYEDLPAYIEQITLYFYAFDEVLADENEEMVEEPERLIGNALTKYGFVDNHERLIFVMNYATDTCYEVQKLDASWTDTH